MSGISDEAIDKALQIGCRLKRADRVGSYAWHVYHNRKKFRVQTDACWGGPDEEEFGFSFAVCDCGGEYEDRTTICPHVMRVLHELAGEYE